MMVPPPRREVDLYASEARAVPISESKKPKALLAFFGYPRLFSNLLLVVQIPIIVGPPENRRRHTSACCALHFLTYMCPLYAVLQQWKRI
jgi:hypothetical protein